MSREKFEAIYEPMGFDMTRMYIAVPEPWSQYKDEKTGYAWAGWLAGRESMRDEAAELCEKISDDKWRLYKGHKPYTGKEPGRASQHVEGISDGAIECESAIRKIEP